jgi:hypothetical protein
MRPQIVGLRVAGTIFGLMFLAQLYRLLTRAEIMVAGHQLPLWASGLALFLAGSLCIWMWMLSRPPMSASR